MERVTEAEVGYIAGIIDGEGCVYWNGSGVYLRVVQADRVLIEWLRTKTGVGGIYTHKDWGTLGKKTIWGWAVNGTHAAYILRRVLPLLIVKKAKTEELLRRYDEAGRNQKVPKRRLTAERNTAELLGALGW